MKVQSYSFGRIIIDEEEYNKDLMICNDKLKPDWVRKKGHLLLPEDISWIMEEDPDLLIVGQGVNGRMKIADETESLVKEENILFWADKTGESVKYFNKKKRQRNFLVSGAFHLTC